MAGSQSCKQLVWVRFAYGLRDINGMCYRPELVCPFSPQIWRACATEVIDLTVPIHHEGDEEAVELGLRALGSGTNNARDWQFIRNGS